VEQGTTTGYISPLNLGYATNGQRALTHYNVTRQPQSGSLRMNDAPANFFSQLNIDNLEVTYVQTDMSAEKDSFECTVTNQVKRLKQGSNAKENVTSLLYRITMLNEGT